MFGRKALLPIEIEMSLKSTAEILDNYDNSPDSATDTTDPAIDSQLKILEEAKANVDRAQVNKKNCIIEIS